MTNERNTERNKGRGWRRKWKRVPAERRRVAATTLADLFARRRAGSLLPLMLGISLLLHGATIPFLMSAGGGSLKEIAASEDSYLRRVIEKDRAKEVSKDVKDRLTMPPPPPEPEQVVERAMTESLTGDVTKVTAGLLNVELQKDLSTYVQTQLKDELAAAAKDIATGKLSEKEIEDLHKKFQGKAQDVTEEWRQKYLEEHQVERAAMSTTEWYENEVSRTLFGNMYYELFLAYNKVWWSQYCREVPTAHWGRWGFVGLGGYGSKVAQLRKLVPAAGKEPEPGAEQAAALANQLRAIHGRQIFDGRFTQWYSWDTAYAHQIEDYFPHRAAEIHQAYDARFKGLWERAFAASETYKDKAEGGAAAELKSAQKAGLDAIRELCEAVGQLIVPNPNDYEAANQAIRSRVLRGPAVENTYRFWVEELVKGLSPMIRDFARGQFKKGIIVHKDGVDEAMKEFPTTVVPLLRRDAERLAPRKVFDRIIFGMDYANPYRSRVTGEDGPPDQKDIEQDEAALKGLVARWPEKDRPYVEARAKVLEQQFHEAVERVKEAILAEVLTGNLLFRRMGSFVEGVDYADKVQEKLAAREMALNGRGQDLAKLTEDGVPDTSAPLVALMIGASKGHGANLEPVETEMQPAMLTRADQPEAALLGANAAMPSQPAKWGFEEQATVKPKFANTPRFEAIPFLTKFPRLDGDLSDWGTIRPLILHPSRAGEPAILVYAAWNYQGFFFGYSVKERTEQFYYPSLWQMTHNHNTGGVWYVKVEGVDWAYRGDYFRLVFDTLDARNDKRGDPHTQEFMVFPMGTESDANVPGIERVIASQRDATRKEYRDVKSSCTIFPQQPPVETGPDGSGPYRVTRQTAEGYTTEVFIPRSLFKTPVFAPGWYIGFDCAVATGVQGGYNQFIGQVWGGGNLSRGGSAGADSPNRWGDLLLLGTDPHLALQEANAAGRLVYSLIPGRSYLLTVIDPDRNVNPAAADTVLVSAEVNGAARDVEVYVLRETGKNTGVFRGYVNTQPGPGRQVQGVLEVMPLQEVRFGYVDFASSKGARNVVNEMTLPVIAPVTQMHLVQLTNPVE